MKVGDRLEKDPDRRVQEAVILVSPKPGNRKRAVEYLAASGAVPISVTERGMIRRQCRLV